MKTKSEKAKLRKGVAVGSAMLVGASGVTVTDAHAKVAQQGSFRMTSVINEPVVTAGEADSSLPMIKVLLPVEPKWTKATARRFQQLVLKRSELQSTPDEEIEFEKLQHTRRLRYIGSPDEIMSEWRRRKFFNEMLDVLNRNARFFNSADQKRVWSLLQTSRK